MKIVVSINKITTGTQGSKVAGRTCGSVHQTGMRRAQEQRCALYQRCALTQGCVHMFTDMHRRREEHRPSARYRTLQA
jgi:hypothetical protein